jgi:osmotically inducible protein OsmC
MAMTLFLGMENLTADSIKTSAQVGLQKEGDGFAIKKIALTTAAKIPGITPEKFQEIAEATKKNCPVSKVLNAEISLAATLE